MGSDRMTLSWGGRDRSVLGGGGCQEKSQHCCAEWTGSLGLVGSRGDAAGTGGRAEKNEIVPVGSWSGISADVSDGCEVWGKRGS